MSPKFHHVQRAMELLVSELRAATGAQVALVVRGEVLLDLAVGDNGRGGMMTPLTPMCVYCAGKPFMYPSLVRAAASLPDGVATPVRDVVPMFATPGKPLVTIDQVWNHSAGLHRDIDFTFPYRPLDQRLKLACEVEVPVDWNSETGSGYSMFAAPTVLEAVITNVLGTSLTEAVRRDAIDAYSLEATFLGLDDAEAKAVQRVVGLNHDMIGQDPSPLVDEMMLRSLKSSDPSTGWYSTARDLARYYSAVSAHITCLHRGREDGSSNAPDRWDVALQMAAAFSHGFARGRVATADVYPGEDAFGHFGFHGSALGFGFAGTGLGCGVVVNGIIETPGSKAFQAAAVVRALMLELAELGLFRA